MITRLISIFIFLTIASTANAQDSNVQIDIDELFELKVDSLEQKITINKWGIDTAYFMHFEVRNISSDTLEYITNTCFYYNHSTLSVGNMEFDLNPSGGCLFNSHNIYRLAPNESFTEAQWITAYDYKLNELKIGEWNSTLSIPLIKDDSTIFRVDGRAFVENKQYLTCDRKTKVMKTVIDNRKVKRTRKKHLTMAKKS